MVSTKRVYDEVLGYCRQKGLIKALEKSFVTTETQHFENLNITKTGLEVIDAVHCVYDKPRTNFFLHELSKIVGKNSVVVEAGVGTGILSLFSATRSAHVSGYELNRSVFLLAQDVSRYLRRKGLLKAEPTFMKADAVKADFEGNIDVLISENIYTGMFFEKQVQIVNHMLPQLKKGGVVLPQKLTSFVFLSETSLPKGFKNKELFIPSPERKVSFVTHPLSKPKRYDSLDFRKHSSLGVEIEMVLSVVKRGKINSIVIYSEVIMPSGTIIRRDDTTFLNSDIIIAIRPTITVKKGDKINLRIEYQYGCNPKKARLRITRQS